MIIHNSAYHGASHGPDVAFCVPVFHDNGLVGFSVTTAHHLDIGALSPGSCGIVDAIDAYAEGLQFKALKVYDRGELNRPLWQMLRDNIRAPDLVVGDMEAQIAAARIGAERFVELIGRYGLETVEAACDELMDHFRAGHAPGDRGPARRSLPGTDLHRRFSRRRRPESRRPADRGCRDGRGQRHHGQFYRHGGAGAGPAHQHAAQGHHRLRRVADDPVDPAGFGGPRAYSAEQRPDPPHRHRRAGRHAGQSGLPGADHSPASARAIKRPTP